MEPTEERTAAVEAADLEVQIVREELMQWGEELEKEGLEEREIVGAFCEALEERLTRLYCEFYELSEIAGAGDMSTSDGLGS